MPVSPEELLNGVQEPLRSIALQIVRESGGRIGITGHGGYRSRAQQQKMYDNYLNGGNLAARPGHSMHERGMAVDFSGDMKLLAQLAAKHGLYNSVEGEPWHYILGEGQKYQGSDHPDFDYDLTADSDPQSTFQNRMIAIERILGGVSPVGTNPMTNPMSFFDEELSSMEFPGQESEANQSIARVSAGAAASGSAAALQAYAKAQLGKYGWSQSEMNALIELWNRESEWNPAADNPTSSAYGIAQQMESVHGKAPRDGQGQIDWGLNYIKSRYGSPSRALSFHNSHNWY